MIPPAVEKGFKYLVGTQNLWCILYIQRQEEPAYETAGAEQKSLVN